MLAESGRRVSSRLFISVGGDEAAGYRRGVQHLAKKIADQKYIRGGFKFREVD
jgi:hypothetical protein